MSRQYTSGSPTSGEPSPISTDTRSISQGTESSGDHQEEQGVAVARLTPSPSPQSPPAPSSSEGYPSWLPKRPPPPAPRSTLQSSVHLGAMFSEPGPSSEPYEGGRKPTPRSVRILSMQSDAQEGADPTARREPTDQSRRLPHAHARVWSRATSAGMTPTLLGSGALLSQIPRPRFRSAGLRLELLRYPSWTMRLFFYLFRILIFTHIPLQTFFDFNAVFILILVAKYPNPAAPGVPGSGRNWALGAAAYIACWAVWIVVVFIVYELVYSFYRRWRVKRPLMFPIYLSSPAFNYVCMTSYTNFCFLYHLRTTAFYGEHGSLRDGLAETAYYYSQNWPTVALLLPRAGLSLALLLAFWTPQAGDVALADAGISPRDGTFFRPDGTLTDYSRGVLIANAAWTAWRILIFLLSLIGLWVLSGQGCAGLCGPRYRWEEEEIEKAGSVVGDAITDSDALPWSWKECTLMRLKDAHDLCLTTKPPRASPGPGKEGVDLPAVPFEGIERVFAAVGLPSGHHPPRRGVLSDELFSSPVPQAEGSVEDEKPRASESAPDLPSTATTPASTRAREKQPAHPPTPPLTKLPYPFVGPGAQLSSSEESVPFPTSHAEGELPSPTVENDDHELEGEEDLEEEASEEPSDRRTSASMSSLGRPITTSRYPFQYRRPTRGGSVSPTSYVSPYAHSAPHSAHTRSMQSRSTQSRSTGVSRSTQSTGTDSRSTGNSNPASPQGSSFSGNGIPMPPRHPQVQRRARAGTVPAVQSPAGSPPPSPPRPRALTRAESVPRSDLDMTFGPAPLPPYEHSGDEAYEGSLMDVPEAEGSIEEEEQDSVGLLSTGPSPRSSLGNVRRHGSGASHRRSNGSRSRSGRSIGSGSQSRSRSTSTTSRSESARSRAQSLIHSIGTASRSSLELVRSRAHSMVRLSDSPYGDSASEGVRSSQDNHTFGHPLREQWRADEVELAEQVPPVPPLDRSSLPPSPHERRETPPASSTHDPSIHGSESPHHSEHAEPTSIPIAGRQPSTAAESHPDISTANQSLMTSPATVQGTTESSGQTPSS